MATHPLKLAAHQQHPCPHPALGALLPGDTIEVAFPVAQKHLREPAEATMLFLIDLRTSRHVSQKRGRK